MSIFPKLPVRPPLDSDFVPAALWNRDFRRLADKGGGPEVELRVYRADTLVARKRERLLEQAGPEAMLNERFLERAAKFLLWQAGGDRLVVDGPAPLAGALRAAYVEGGARSFDAKFFGRVFLRSFTIAESEDGDSGEPESVGRRAAGSWNGCRVGFDLGASDRKCAAVVDGEVVHSEEVRWDPAASSDPRWHLEQMQDSIHRAAAKLPRLDAIGGCAAGILIDGEVRASSLFRGVADGDFEARVRGIFRELRESFGGVPFAVLNDGAAAALLGAIATGRAPVLGLALGSSLGAGSVDESGRVFDRFDELAFAPIDYSYDAPVDAWSGDRGCAGQYLSQQGIARLLPRAGITIPDVVPPAERLACLQQLMTSSNDSARKVYQTLGVYLGYAIAHFSDFYAVRDVVVLGRVLTGTGGGIIIDEARRVLAEAFPEMAKSVRVDTLDETAKRHGQAVAAASLPSIP